MAERIAKSVPIGDAGLSLTGTGSERIHLTSLTVFVLTATRRQRREWDRLCARFYDLDGRQLRLTAVPVHQVGTEKPDGLPQEDIDRLAALANDPRVSDAQYAAAVNRAVQRAERIKAGEDTESDSFARVTAYRVTAPTGDLEEFFRRESLRDGSPILGWDARELRVPNGMGELGRAKRPLPAKPSKGKSYQSRDAQSIMDGLRRVEAMPAGRATVRVNPERPARVAPRNPKPKLAYRVRPEDAAPASVRPVSEFEAFARTLAGAFA